MKSSKSARTWLAASATRRKCKFSTLNCSSISRKPTANHPTISSVKAILDANRNSLMLLEIKFSIGTLGIGTGALIAGLYGMNLRNFMEESNVGFLGVTGTCFVFAAIVVAIGLQKLRRVQRVRMWGERGPGTRGSWNQIEPGAVRPGIRDRNRAWRGDAGAPKQLGGIGNDTRSLGCADGAVDSAHDMPRVQGSTHPTMPVPVATGKKKRPWTGGGGGGGGGGVVREKDVGVGGSIVGEKA